MRREGAVTACEPQTDGPRIARRAWEGWKRLGRQIGDFQARLLLTLFYIIVITPFALLVRVIADPLTLKPATPKGWRPRATTSDTGLQRARKQF